MVLQLSHGGSGSKSTTKLLRWHLLLLRARNMLLDEPLSQESAFREHIDPAVDVLVRLFITDKDLFDLLIGKLELLVVHLFHGLAVLIVASRLSKSSVSIISHRDCKHFSTWLDDDHVALASRCEDERMRLRTNAHHSDRVDGRLVGVADDIALVELRSHEIEGWHGRLELVVEVSHLHLALVVRGEDEVLVLVHSFDYRSLVVAWARDLVAAG